MHVSEESSQKSEEPPENKKASREERADVYESIEENQDIISLVEKVESGAFDPKEKIDLGTVPDGTALKIEKLTGINVKGFKVAIEARQINHILIDHGKNGKNDNSMSDSADIAKMEYAMQNSDDISLGKSTQAYKNIVNGKTRGSKTVLYEKSIGAKSYYVVQAVPDTKAKTLFVVSAFIGEKGYKKGASQFTNAESLGATSEIGTANASNNSIPQNSDLSTGSEKSPENKKASREERYDLYEDNRLERFSKKQIENWRDSQRIVIYQNIDQFSDFIEEALNNKQFSKKIYFGKISEDYASMIRKQTGLDLTGYNCSLSADEIRKIFKDHGDEQRESNRGQRAVQNRDLLNIPEVLRAPDEIELSEKEYDGKPGIYFKKYIDGKMTVVAVVSDKHLDLRVQTAYIGAKKGNLSTPTGEQAPANTPEATRGTISNSSISQKTQNVNTLSEKSDLIEDGEDVKATVKRKPTATYKAYSVSHMQEILKGEAKLITSEALSENWQQGDPCRDSIIYISKSLIIHQNGRLAAEIKLPCVNRVAKRG